MPTPDKTIFTQLAQSIFRSKGIIIPVDWSEPNNQFQEAFKEEDRNVTPNTPTCLFKEATQNRYHVDAAKRMSDKFSTFIKKTCHAICDGIEKWLKMASIAGVTINGSIGTIRPGCVIGPKLQPLILPTAPKKRLQEYKYSYAIAKALSTSWEPWHLKLSGMILYPSFALFQGSIAPPTANFPIPIAGLSSSGETQLAPENLVALMKANLNDPEALHATELFDSIAKAFNTIFQTFKTTTIIHNLLGTGPIPNFVSPLIPAGPVIGGSVLPLPGVII